MFVPLPLGDLPQSGVWHQIHHRGEWRERQLLCFICKCVLYYIPSACALSQTIPSFPLSVLFGFALHFHLLLYAVFVQPTSVSLILQVYLFIICDCFKTSWIERRHSSHCLSLLLWLKHEHFISKALMDGIAVMTAIVRLQMCLFLPYIPIFYCCHGYCFHLSIYPSILAVLQGYLFSPCECN